MLLSENIPRPRKWRHICNYGFEKCRAVVDVAGSIMILLNRSHEWADECPAFIFEGDIKSAFGYMSHSIAEEAMVAAGWPENSIAAVHSSNSTLTCSATIAELEVEYVHINACYRQGSVEGPRIWKMIMMHVLSLIVPLWFEMGYGLRIDSWIDRGGDVRNEPRVLTHFIWADNVWLLANSSAQLRHIVKSLTSLLSDRKLIWKASDMKCMSTSSRGIADFYIDAMDENFEKCEMLVENVNDLTVLGTKIAWNGDTITAMNHRLGKAEGQFAEFREVLCTRAGSLKKIFEEYVKRVVPVFLHGCGA